MGIAYSNVSNRNLKNGIRFGIISANKISGDALGEFMPPDLPPTCPECGEVLEDESFCDKCEEEVLPDFQEYDGPLFFKKDGYSLALDSSNDIWVLESPYKAIGAHCSPCAPGSISLGLGEDDWGLALGPEWFDEYSPMPYEVEKV